MGWLSQFIAGMKLHDIAKPFFLGGRKHSKAGFAILQNLGKKDESLIALAHHNLKDNLKLFFSSGSAATLPSYLYLTSPIDRLAASTYSFMGGDLSGEYTFSIQNPFSRLPILLENSFGEFSETFAKVELWSPLTVSMGTKRPLTVLSPSDKVAGLHKKILLQRSLSEKDTLHESLWEKAGFSSDWKNIDEKLNDKTNVTLEVVKIERLLEPYSTFPERTYPPVNDTRLREHGRLCAALALVVGGNLVLKKDNFVAEEIEFDSNNCKPTLMGNYRQEAEKFVMANSGCLILRVCFEEARELFYGAVRLDDLHGARKLLEDFTHKFKDTLAKELASAITDNEKGLCEVIEPLNEFAFDLVYLLPGRLKDVVVRDCIRKAGEFASEEISNKLCNGLQTDFRDTGAAQQFENKEDDLRNLLLNQIINHKYVRVNQKATGDFEVFKKKFGDLLYKEYRGLMQHEYLKVNDYKRPHDELKEPCEVCGRRDVFVGFYDYYDAAQENEKEKLEKVMYSHHGEVDRLCLLCLASRTLSHGTVKEEWLANLIEVDNGQISVKEDPMTPPHTVRFAKIEEGEDSVDLISCFVRVRNGEKQVFPTITAAADEDSNVALLWLMANNEAVFGEYSFREGVPITWKGEEGESDIALFYKYYLNVCLNAERTKEEVEELTVIKPHLGRTLARIRWIENCYKRATQYLLDDKIRALTIEDRYPLLIFAFPASEIVRALRCVHRCLSEELFSSRAYKSEDCEARKQSFGFLDKILPPILTGTVIIFKNKQPLYNVLSTAKTLFDKSPKEDWKGGLRLGLVDLRGGMAVLEECKVYANFASGLYEVLELADKIDRLSILRASAEEQDKLREAQLYIRGERKGWDTIAGRLSEKELFDPVHFMKVISKD